MDHEFHIRFRPQTWREVVGHESVTKAIQHSLDNQTSRSFLLTGPPGVGKTTMARLIARDVDVDPASGTGGYTEYDGATNTGVDDARALINQARLRPLDGGNKVIVIDECHMLSTSAWNAMLKVVEEPPPGLFWVFCTSEGSKVPASIRSRCQEFVLSEVSEKAIGGLLVSIVKLENLDVSDDMIDLVVDHAHGSPRNALVGLGKILGLGNDIEAAERVLAGVAAADNAEVIELCRKLLGGSDFRPLASVVLKLQGRVTAEGVRNVVCEYFVKVSSGKQWRRAAAVLDAFGDPYPPGLGNRLYPVLVSLARLFGDELE